MKALILAAGIASRLRPLTDATPKCLLKIGERCLLERTFDALISNQIVDFVVVTGYCDSQIIDFLNRRYIGLNIKFIHNECYSSTNNIYSLWLAKSEARGQDILLLDSDILFDPQIITAVLNNPASNALALNRHELGEEEIKVIIDSDQRVVEISKVCSIEDALGESVGIEKMSSCYTEALYAELDQMIEVENQKNVFYERAFERLISKDFFFEVEDTTKYFSIELDTVDDFNQAKRLIPIELY
jgi:Predicted sugar nucleotidyltransferases